MSPEAGTVILASMGLMGLPSVLRIPKEVKKEARMRTKGERLEALPDLREAEKPARLSDQI